MSSHTPGPWEVTGKGLSRYIEGRLRPGILQEVAWCGATEAPGQMEANARLIAAAPELFEVIAGRLENEKQRAFEDWLAITAPSGDVEQVQDQWRRSYRYLGFCDEWAAERNAIAKATGEQE